MLCYPLLQFRYRQALQMSSTFAYVRQNMACLIQCMHF